MIKGCAHYILLVCFLSLKENICETRKNVISPQKLFSFSRKSNLRISDIQVP